MTKKTAEVSAQYEAYPYPERNPEDERKRLITGSPSHPLEIDHHVFAGLRDWNKPLRVLVAGGGTGDGLIQIAQVMKSANRTCHITYVDMSRAACEIAKERAKVRGLECRFVIGSLLDAPEMGTFDYIDCCGVLHHLPDPQQGFDALAQTLAPDGGLGFMVYAPYGRSGVYPLQEAFGALLRDLPPKEKLAKAKAIFKRIPKSHPFRLNPHLSDHQASDAGFYDLLLHAQDRPYTVGQLLDSLERAGLALSGFTQPALYDPAPFLPEGMAAPDCPKQRMELAEKLRGSLRLHVGYAVRAGKQDKSCANGTNPALVPHLKGVAAPALAAQIERKGRVGLTLGPEKEYLELPKKSAPLIARIDGRTSLANIAKALGMDPISFNAAWAPVHKGLGGYGVLLYSGLISAG